MSKTTYQSTGYSKSKTNRESPSSFEELAIKQELADQLYSTLLRRDVSKSTLADRMNTSRAAVDRLLDGTNTSVTLATLGKAARALGCTFRIKVVPVRA
jgi:DNA-binding Xre family transcriptional regulator